MVRPSTSSSFDGAVRVVPCADTAATAAACCWAPCPAVPVCTQRQRVSLGCVQSCWLPLDVRGWYCTSTGRTVSPTDSSRKVRCTRVPYCCHGRAPRRTPAGTTRPRVLATPTQPQHRSIQPYTTASVPAHSHPTSIPRTFSFTALPSRSPLHESSSVSLLRSLRFHARFGALSFSSRHIVE